MPRQPLGRRLRVDANEVLRDRQAVWRAAQRKLMDEGESLGVPDKDWLDRMKLVDDRLGVLFGDRQQAEDLKPKAVKERAKSAGGRLQKYKLVS